MNLASMLLAILILLCPLAVAQKVVAARAGMVYYAEGEFRVDGKLLRSTASGRLPQLQDGQVAASPRGHAEVLLGPSAVLWIGTRAQVRFDDTSVENAAVSVLDGEAIVELTRHLDASRIRVRAGSLDVELTREGVYRFSAASGSVRVYGGEILPARVGRGEERDASGTRPFDRGLRDEFFYWSAYRSLQLEADAGAFRQWGGGAWGKREHSGFDVQFPEAPGAARAKYLAASAAGLVYYLEGAAITGSQSRNPARLPLALGQDNFIRTEAGRAEIFLGVGVIARLADHSALRMIQTNSANPVAALDEGTALIEVSGDAEASLRLRVGDSETALFKQGLYAFDAKALTLRVFAGEATVGSSRVRESQQLDLAPSGRITRFDPKTLDPKTRDALFRWSAERSFALFLTPAGFMTQWDAEARRGWFKHKVFGERRDPRPGRPRPRIG